MSNHETIIRTGITCNKTSCYMGESACRWLVVENAKIFQSYVKNFWISHAKEIVESLLVYANKFTLMQISFRPIMFLHQDNKMNLLLASFSYFLELLWEKINFNLEIVIVINNRFNLSILKKLTKLLCLHCPRKKVVQKSNKENLKGMKNTLPNKSRNPESLKK